MPAVPARGGTFISYRTRLLPGHCALWSRMKLQPPVSLRELACTVGTLHVSKAPMRLLVLMRTHGLATRRRHLLAKVLIDECRSAIAALRCWRDAFFSRVWLAERQSGANLPANIRDSSILEYQGIEGSTMDVLRICKGR